MLYETSKYNGKFLEPKEMLKKPVQSVSSKDLYSNDDDTKNDE
jgi:hypothetical protein